MRASDDKQPLPDPPAPLRRTSPFTLELKEGGGCMAAFGLPFFLAGVFLALTATGIVPMKNAPDQNWTPVLTGFMSLVFLGAGGALVFGRQWITLDASRGSVVLRRGLLIPIQTKERRLTEFNAVVIGFTAGDSDSPDQYPVHLRAVAGTDFVISKPAKFGDSRKQAEYLCRFLSMPLADATTDHETLVGPEQIGQTLQERLLSGGVEAGSPMRPSAMHCAVHESDGEITIVMPGKKSSLAGLFAALIPAVLFLTVVPAIMRFFARTETPRGMGFTLLIFLMLAFGIPLIFVSVNLLVGNRRRGTTVKASPAGLVIERRGTWRTSTKLIPACDILDLDYSTFEGTLASAKSSSGTPGASSAGAERIFAFLKKWVPAKGIIVKSRQELIPFGEGLPANELQYLNWALRTALTRR